MKNYKKKQKKRYFTELCDDKLTFQECELAILRNAIDETEKQQGRKIANSEDIKKILTIVEDFLAKKKLICYGGTAINNILPKFAQFYDRDVEIPDYDFYSSNALEDAKELADLYYNAGYEEVEAKSGVHLGTFKVFVDFIPIADITHLDKRIYDEIAKESITADRIRYAPPNFLRMNMFLELSRPAGDVSRWEKVLKRLNLLIPLISNVNWTVKQITPINYILQFVMVSSIKGLSFSAGMRPVYILNICTKTNNTLRNTYLISMFSLKNPIKPLPLLKNY